MLTIKDAMRAGHVIRWQIVRTARPQTLAEHSFLVAILAQHIYKVICVKPDAETELQILRWALRHDLPEVMTGDVAGHMKRKIRSLSEEDPFDEIERDIDPQYADLKSLVVGKPAEKIVKIADLQESIVFLSVEGMGSHAELVRNNIYALFKKEVIRAEALGYSGWRWNLCFDILDILLNGKDGVLEMEGG